MKNLLAFNAVAQLKQAAEPEGLAKMKRAEVTVVVFHASLHTCGDDGLPSQVGPGGGWGYSYIDPVTTLAARDAMQRMGIAVVHYVHPYKYLQVCGHRAAYELRAWVQSCCGTGRFGGVFLDGPQINDNPDVNTPWLRKLRQVAGVIVGHDSLGARAGGRPACWQHLSYVMYGELAATVIPLTKGPDDPLLDFLEDPVTGYYNPVHCLHPYHDGVEKSWWEKPWPKRWVERGGSLYLHWYDMDWTATGLGRT